MSPRPIAAPVVSTILSADERARVDAASGGVYRTVHRESFAAVLEDLRRARTHAVVVSVSRCIGETPRGMRTMVREFPRVPTVALLSRDEQRLAETMLSLGRDGVQHVVDVREASGWNRLRQQLAHDESGAIEQETLGALRRELSGATAECWRFFEQLVVATRHPTTVQHLARALDVQPSTLNSRFFRRGLPAPKRYVAYARLVRAARLLENPGTSIAQVAVRLEYSSPQSFCRHIGTWLGETALSFRRTHDGARMLARLCAELVRPYATVLRGLTPLRGAASEG